MLPLPVDTTKDGIRELTPDEIRSVEHVFISTGNPLPDPQTSTFMGAVKGGKVIGFVVLQVKLHAEPWWIEEGHSDIFKSLVKGAEQIILNRCGPQWVYAFTPAGRVTQLAASMGMQQEPWCVMSKLLVPDTPSKQEIGELVVPQLDLDLAPTEGGVQ